MNYLNNRKEILNNDIIGNITETIQVQNTNPLYIFVGNKGNSPTTYIATIKLHEFKVSDESNIIHNFVPCYRKNDNMIGLYDTVSGVFYTNQGTGTFNKGDDVAVEYVTSSTKVTNNKNHTLYAT